MAKLIVFSMAFFSSFAMANSEVGPLSDSLENIVIVIKWVFSVTWVWKICFGIGGMVFGLMQYYRYNQREETSLMMPVVTISASALLTFSGAISIFPEIFNINSADPITYTSDGRVNLSETAKYDFTEGSATKQNE